MPALLNQARLPGGLTLPYVEQGDPNGIPVIFLHGITDSWRSFEPVLPHLPSQVHAFALTQRGHGDAGRPEEGYTPQDFAADVVAFMDTLGIEKAVIAGHSMGSYVAQCFAFDYPERTLGIVLAGSFVKFEGNQVLEEFTEVVMGLEDPIEDTFVREFQEATLNQPVAGGWVDIVTAESFKVPARVWKGAFVGLAESDFSSRLAEITAPTLIVAAGEDAFMPRADQDELASRIPNSRLLVYQGAGHAMHWEEPARFAEDIAQFALACRQQEKEGPQ